MTTHLEYLNIDPDVQESDVMDLICQRARPELRPTLLGALKSFENFEAMLALGSQLENAAPPAVSRPNRSTERIASNRHTNGTRPSPSHDKANPTTSRSNSPTQQSPTSDSNASKKDPFCGRCKSKGHYASACTAPAPVAGRPRVNRVRSRRTAASTPDCNTSEGNTSESVAVVASVLTPGSRLAGNGTQ